MKKRSVITLTHLADTFNFHVGDTIHGSMSDSGQFIPYKHQRFHRLRSWLWRRTRIFSRSCSTVTAVDCTTGTVTISPPIGDPPWWKFLK